jgi:hypothetical protein
MASTCAFSVTGSFARAVVDLQMAAAKRPAEEAGTLVVGATGVVALGEVAVEVEAIAGVDCVAAAGVELAVLVVVELALPQPASKAPQSSAVDSHADRVRFIGSPRVESWSTPARPALWI